MAIELPSPSVDLSDLLVRIKNNCEAIAIRQTQARLAAYTQAVAARDKALYKDWRLLPVAALKSLDEKLKQELAAMPPERVKGVAAETPPKLDEFF